MKKFFHLLIIPSMILFLIGCNGCSEKKPMTEEDVARIQQDMISETRKQHEEEIKDIDKFIRKKDWPMQQTGTGLRYWIYEPGQGAKIKLDDAVFISYKIELLDGTFCYETTDDQPKRIVVGYDNVETGLHEALQLLSVGDHARLILPSHLAFGFSGDSGKIPQNAAVVYDIHVVGKN